MTSIPARCSTLTHIAKLVHWTKPIPARTVGLVRRKERDWSVTPIVDETNRTILSVKLAPQ